MMHKSKAITLLTSLILLISFNISKAACPLSISNLSINTQTSKDKADIIRLQSILYTNNLYTGPITGYYGKLTETAINNLKRDNDLTTNGIVDQSTVNLICSNYSCPFKSLLEKNDEYPKQEIKFIQSFLRLLPNIYEEKLVTGFYGTKTENAVKRLQSYLNISDTGSIDIKTRQEFCNFFTTFDSTDVESSTSNTSSIFQTLCLPFPKQVNTGDQVLFISQILGGNSPYKYIWNNKTTNTDKTFKTSFSKAGTYTVSLKVIDNKGNISSSNCKVGVVGDTIAGKDTEWEGISFDNLPLIDNSKTSNTIAKIIEDPLNIIPILNTEYINKQHIFVHAQKNIPIGKPYKIDFLVLFASSVNTFSLQKYKDLCFLDTVIFKKVLNEQKKEQDVEKTPEELLWYYRTDLGNVINKNNVKYYQYKNRNLMTFTIEDKCSENSIVRYKAMIDGDSYNTSIYREYTDRGIEQTDNVIEIYCGDTSRILQEEKDLLSQYWIPAAQHSNVCTMLLSSGGNGLAMDMLDSKCLKTEVLPSVDFGNW